MFSIASGKPDSLYLSPGHCWSLSSADAQGSHQFRLHLTDSYRSPADIGSGEEELALGVVPGDRAEGVDDEGDELVAGHRPDLVEPSQ